MKNAYLVIGIEEDDTLHFMGVFQDRTKAEKFIDKTEDELEKDGIFDSVFYIEDVYLRD